MGFSVFCCDINIENIKVSGVDIKKADLNKDLPYNDSFFDYVCSIEGIEHLENPYHLIREFNRIVKKGGKLIISIPSVMNLPSRLHYLLYGWFGGFPPLTNNLYDFEKNPFPHINPINYLELKFILEKDGFKIENVSVNRLQYVKFLKPLNLFIRLISKLHYKLMPKQDFSTLLMKSEESYSRIKEFGSDEIQYSEILILKAKKIKDAI